MGTYYRYINFTREEFVSLCHLRDDGDKEGAALRCGSALVWLLLWPHSCGDGYRGRWSHQPGGRRWPHGGRSDDVRVVGDGEVSFEAIEDDFVDITPGVLQSMREQAPALVADFAPRTHDLRIVQRVYSPERHIHLVADPCSATCRCGWSSGLISGPLSGEEREHLLERAISRHLWDLDAAELLGTSGGSRGEAT